MYTLDPDTYSSIVELLPINAINQLRVTDSTNSHQLSTLRNTDNYWKLRLQKFLDIQITRIPTPETWHQVYIKITAGDLNLSQKLIKFIQTGDFQVVQLLLDAGADVTADDNAALLLASRRGHFQVVQLLVDAGADVTAEDNAALREASRNGHFQVVQVLLEAGADPSDNNNAALLEAFNNGHFQVVQLLRKFGVTL